MATEFTDYPEALDVFTNPTIGDSLDTVEVPLDVQESGQNDAIEALEAKVGADNNVDTASLDYRVRQLEGSVGTPVTPTAGTGFSEGVVDGGLGRLYTDITAPDTPVFWVKTTASGNTGWKQLIA